MDDLLDDDIVITTAGWLSTPATKDIWVAEVATQHMVHWFEIHTVDVRNNMGAVAAMLMASTQSAT